LIKNSAKHIISVSTMKKKVTIGISSCLLGNNVRWDGDHNANKIIINNLGRYFDLYPICPEVEIGMDVPREPINLEGNKNDPRMIAKNSRKDWTSEMSKYSRGKIAQLENKKISGLILKSNSPSCGLRNIPIYGNIGQSPKTGIGLFANTVTQYFEFMPIVDEDFVKDINLRKLFVIKSYFFSKLSNLFRENPNKRNLLDYIDSNIVIISTAEPDYIKNFKKTVNEVNNLGSPRFKKNFYSQVMAILTTRDADKILNYIEAII